MLLFDKFDQPTLAYFFRRFTKKLNASCNISTSALDSLSSLASLMFSARISSPLIGCPVWFNTMLLFFALPCPSVNGISFYS